VSAPADQLAVVSGVASFLRWRCDGPGAEPGPGELDCAVLARDAGAVAAAVADSADGRGSDDPQVAASLWWQGYAYRVAGTALACWLMTGTAPDVRAAGMAVGIARSRPSSVVYRPASAAGGPGATTDLDTFVDWLFPGHLDPVAATLRAGTRIGAALVWGNVAAACASGAGAVREAAGPAWHPRLDAFLAAAPHGLAGLGAWAPTPDRRGWAFHRRTCCLWWKTAVSGGALCADCSLHRSDDTRTSGDTPTDDVTDRSRPSATPTTPAPWATHPPT
jgi:iron complex transport system ATP-binding protein